MTRRGVLWLGVGCTIFLLLFAFAKIEGGFLPWFLLYFYTVFFLYELITVASGVRTVETSRRVSATRLSAGQSVTIEVTVFRTGVWPLPWLRITEQVPKGNILGATLSQSLLPLWTKEIKYDYRIPDLSRGIYRIASTDIETGDIFGLVRHRRTDQRHDEILVYPKVVPVRGWTGLRPEEIGLRQPTRKRAEDSTNVLGVRGYVPGDRLSRIHWPATARKGSLQAKEFELHVTSEMMFLPDCSDVSFADRFRLFELEMTITASLIKYAYDMRRRFGAMIYSENLHTFAPGCNEALFLRCMEKLAEVQPNAKTPFPEALVRMGQETPSGCSFVVLSPQLNRESAVAAASLRKRGPVEWFVPIERETLSENDKAGLQMLQSARVSVHLIRQPLQLSNMQRGGGARANVLGKPRSGV